MEKLEVETPDDEKKCKRNSFRQKAISASRRFRTSFIKKGRRKGKFGYGCSRFGPKMLIFSVTGSKYGKLSREKYLILTAFSGDGLGRIS